MAADSAWDPHVRMPRHLSLSPLLSQLSPRLGLWVGRPADGLGRKPTGRGGRGGGSAVAGRRQAERRRPPPRHGRRWRWQPCYPHPAPHRRHPPPLSPLPALVLSLPSKWSTSTAACRCGPTSCAPAAAAPSSPAAVPAHRRPAAPAYAVARFAHHLLGPPAGRCGCCIAGRFCAAVGDGARCLSLRCPDLSCSVAGRTNNTTLAYQIWHELSHSS
uniref:Uncharacterized protein n=1 Tax=Oryza meridionalis TaxID=40149 RepID=A0A0E0BXU3_9ORYZ